MSSRRNPTVVTREVIATMNTLYQARAVARRLREAKPGHLWTSEEHELLAELCKLLGVE